MEVLDSSDEQRDAGVPWPRGHPPGGPPHHFMQNPIFGKTLRHYPYGRGSVKMRMPSPAQRAPREQAVGSECTGYSSAAPKAEADINSWGSLRHNAARISQTWDSALYGGADPPGGCPSGPRDALVPLVSRRIKPFQNPAGRPGGRRAQRAPPRASAPLITQAYACGESTWHWAEARSTFCN